MKPFAISSTAYTHLPSPSIRASHPQQGFALTELVIYALIAGLASLGLAFLYNKVVITNTANAFLDNANIINVAMKSLGDAPNYSNSDYATTLAKNKTFDTTSYSVTFSGNTATVTNRWGGRVTIVGNTTNFLYTEPNVPEDTCISNLPKLQTAAWSSVQVGSTTVPVPVTAAVATTTCNGRANITLTSNG